MSRTSPRQSAGSKMLLLFNSRNSISGPRQCGSNIINQRGRHHQAVMMERKAIKFCPPEFFAVVSSFHRPIMQFAEEEEEANNNCHCLPPALCSDAQSTDSAASHQFVMERCSGEANPRRGPILKIGALDQGVQPTDLSTHTIRYL